MDYYHLNIRAYVSYVIEYIYIYKSEKIIADLLCSSWGINWCVSKQILYSHNEKIVISSSSCKDSWFNGIWEE